MVEQSTTYGAAVAKCFVFTRSAFHCPRKVCNSLVFMSIYIVFPYLFFVSCEAKLVLKSIKKLTGYALANRSNGSGNCVCMCVFII